MPEQLDYIYCQGCKKLKPGDLARFVRNHGWRCKFCKSRHVGVRRGPRTVQIHQINGIPTQVKFCRGPVCKGKWRPVKNFFEIKPPGKTQHVTELSITTPTRFKYYSSQCRDCNAYRDSRRVKPVGLVPVAKVQIWVDALLSKCGNSPYEAARLCGLNPSSLHHLRMGYHKMTRRETAAKVLKGLLIARQPSYRPPERKKSRGIAPSARQLRNMAADNIDEHGDLYHPRVDTEAAA